MLDDLFRTIHELATSFQERLSVKTVYGDPISANGVTVVPVARVGFGFGGGGGGGTGTGPATGEAGSETTTGGSGGGGGGGGGGMVQPIGYIEITEAGTRWVAVERSRSEQVLRFVLALIAAAPRGGPRGFLGRLALIMTAQALLSDVFSSKMPALPANLRVPGRSEAEPA